jgi:murein DD-endopeptidase MepM/ murein hydrolase activator NlpD
MHFPLLLSAAFLWVFTFQTNNISEKSSRPSSKPNSDTLYWNDGIKLTWDDFKAKSTDTKGYAAYTFTMITLNYEVKTSGQTFTPTFTVKCAFQKSKSWVNRKDTNSQTHEILAHEQLHFTIAEITARKLRRNLKVQQYTKNYKNEIKEIYNKTLDEGEKMQQRYDKETNHSIDKEAQKRWSYLIESDLGYLMGYQSN